MDDLDLVTTQKIYYPGAYNNLPHVSKNFHCLVQLAGDTSIVALELKNVKEHVLRFESDYTYHFREFQGFSTYFVNKIHVGVQKFIHSCALGSILNLNISAIKFGTFLKSIENKEISFVSLPAFVKKKEERK